MINQKYNEINKKQKFNFNYGILKIYLSFLVVNTHCFNSPSFYIMSYYMCYKLFVNKNIEKIKQRFQRLLIPYILWPIIIFIFNNLFNYLLKMNLKYDSFNCLKYQLLTGHCSLPALWFQFDLIFSTFLIIIIILLFKKNIEFILINITIFCYILQYSNINYKLFMKLISYERYSFGRFLEVIPFCISGYILTSLNIIQILKKNRIKAIYIFLLISIILRKYTIFTPIYGFGYAGINLHINSLSIFIISSLLSSDIIKNKNINNIIKILSSITPGIYYIHYPIYLYLKNFFLLIKNQTLFGSIIIYITCTLISLIGSKLFANKTLKHLFQ